MLQETVRLAGCPNFCRPSKISCHSRNKSFIRENSSKIEQASIERSEMPQDKNASNRNNNENLKIL